MSERIIPKLSIVVMAYNEAESLNSTVVEIQNTISKTGIPFEMLIIDDGSTDETPAIIKSLTTKYSNIRSKRHIENLGLGEVYRSGFADSCGQFITFFPADGQFPAENILALLENSDSYDLVLGYINSSNRHFSGRVASLCEQCLYRIMFGYIPRFQGVFLLRSSLLSSIPLESEGRGWAIVFELIIKAHRGGYKIKSIFTQLRPRRFGKSKVTKLSSVFLNLKQIYKLRQALAKNNN